MDNFKSRAEWIDACRGVGILIVLLGHCNPPFNKLIYSFHMPLFFILSRYLYKNKKDVFLYGKRLLIRYIVPYFLLCSINLIFALLTGKAGLLPKYIVGIAYSRGTVEWMPNCSPLWFLTCLAVALFIFNVIMNIDNRITRIVMIVTCCSVSYMLDISHAPKLFWNLDSALMAVLFIYIGYKIYLSNSFLFNHNAIKVTLLVCIGFFAAHFNGSVSFDGNEYGNMALMMCSGIFISFGLLYLFKHINNPPQFLSYFGKHTLFFVGFDYFSGTLALKIIHKLGLLSIQNYYFIEFFLKIAILSVGLFLWNTFIKYISNEKLRRLLSI